MATRAEGSTESSSTYSRYSIYTNDGLGPAWKFWRRKRYILALLMFYGGINVLTIRANISMAITAMVTGHGVSGGEFDWDMETQGYVLSSFFYGTILLPFAAGYLSTKVGATKLVGIGVGVPAFLSIFTEYFARAHVVALMFLRFLEGTIQALAIASSLGVWPVWVPPLECHRLTAFAYSGGYVGMLLTMTLSGPIIAQFKWGAVFVIFGCVGVLWYGLWLGLIYTSPMEHPYIHPNELAYLMDNLQRRDIVRTYPWKEIFTSPAVYGVIVNQFAILWGQYTLTQMPMFLEDVLKYDIIRAGLVSAMPYMILIIMMQVTGHAVYIILKKNYTSATKVRKVCICVGFLSEGACLFFIGFTYSQTLVALLIAGAAVSASLSESNFFANVVEISGPYASVLAGISNTFCALSGIISPILTGYLVPEKTREEWMVVFMIAACVYWFAGIFYFFFGSGERENWAKIEEPVTEESESSYSSSSSSSF